MRWYDFPGQDDEYKRRRAELLAAEIALKDQVERVAALRRALPVGMRVPDHAFREGPPDLARNDPATCASPSSSPAATTRCSSTT